ncbi:MAG TPA: 6-phosphogluconolactonase [Meiothermus sp.]|nr:6-phosphogluconolactonase [Meiothermus sp.]
MNHPSLRSAKVRLEVFDTSEAAARAAADLLAERLSAGGRAVLAGGRTPLLAYRLFGKADLLWYRLQLIPSDERCLPAEHPERNDQAIAAALGPQSYTLHRFPAELGPEKAAEQMEETVRELLPFDLALLGLGEDGHTASLFPGNLALESPRWVVPVHDAPKAPPERVSLGLAALSQTRTAIYLVTGAEKQEPLRRLLAGEDIPPNRVQADEVIVLADQAARGER